jgi:hypothetical protein
MEGVVVQDEQRGDHHGAALALPHRVRVLGREHVEAPAELDQLPVPLLAARLHRVGLRRPQFVVARHPDDLLEAGAQRVQRAGHVGEPLGDVARDDQPVLGRLRPQRLDVVAVLRVRHMHVADREQGARHAGAAFLAGCEKLCGSS